MDRRFTEHRMQEDLAVSPADRRTPVIVGVAQTIDSVPTTVYALFRSYPDLSPAAP